MNSSQLGRIPWGMSGQRYASHPNLALRNNYFTASACRMGIGPYLLIDGGSDFIILGQNWHVFHRFEHARIGMQSPEEFGQFTASMDKAAGIRCSALKDQSC